MFLLLSSVICTFIWIAVHGKDPTLWKTVDLGKAEDCQKIWNDGMEAGDMYTVIFSGNYHPNVKPAECSMVLNFGGRKISAQLIEWKCSSTKPEPASKDGPFLGLYDNCDGTTSNPLATMNCTAYSMELLRASGTCISLYHYQGKFTNYAFKVQFTARSGILGFPAWSISAIIVSSLVIIMVIIKITCVISGFENRLPKLNISEEDERRIMEEAVLYNRMKALTKSRANMDYEGDETQLPGTNSTNTHNLDVYSGASDRPPPKPRIKRYPSYRHGSIFKK